MYQKLKDANQEARDLEGMIVQKDHEIFTLKKEKESLEASNS